MQFVGIDIASETHVFAILDAEGTVLAKPKPFTEDAAGHGALLAALAPPGEALVVMEATGHYWKNLFAVLAAKGYEVALINPLRTHRFQGESLERTKTDAIDALGLARFDSPAALAAYVGVIPALRHSGKRRPTRAGITPIGNARLRTALWMPTLTAVRRNPWLKAFYDRLRAQGKPPKLALVAAMRKLLVAVYAVAKARKPFVPKLAD